MAARWCRTAFVVLLTSLIPAVAAANGGAGYPEDGADNRRAAVAEAAPRPLDSEMGRQSESPSRDAGVKAAPVGSEFQVNSYTTSYQTYPAVAVDSDGDFVVVWQSRGSSGSDTGGVSVQGQRFASDGTAVGGEFQVNSYTTSSQFRPAVAVESDGDFVVVWSSVGSSGSDTHGASIQGQRFTSDGTAVGSEFQVNSYTTLDQRNPAVAVESDGDFVVVWRSDGSSGSDIGFDFSVLGQRFASDGTAVGSEFQVNSYTIVNQQFAAVAVDSAGDFVVVWQSGGSSGSDTDSYSVQGQRFASDGTAVGSEFQVNSYTTSIQFRPAVAVESDGDFVVVWQSRGSSGSDTSGDSIQGQRFASDGTAVGGEFQVNSYTTSKSALSRCGGGVRR